MARLKAHEEAERARKLAEESEMKGIQDALGRERDRERQDRDRERQLRLKLDREADAARREREEEMQREMKESDDRQERRRSRNQGVRVWGGWRRELGVSARSFCFFPFCDTPPPPRPPSHPTFTRLLT